MQTHFGVRRYGSTATTEVLAGVTSFLTLSYVLSVNPFIMRNAGMPFAGVFVATALSAGMCTLLLALLANTPYTMAPAMGCNAYFANVICLGLGYPWQEALCIGLFAGVVHLAIMGGRFRRPFTNHCLPKHLKYAGAIGVGTLVAIGGADAAGLAGAGNAAFDLSRHIDALPPIIDKFAHANLATIAGLLTMAFLLAMEKKTGDRYGAVPMGVLAAAFIGIPLGATNLTALRSFDGGMLNEWREVALAIFGDPGLLSLASSPERLLTAIAIGLATALFRLTDSVATVIGMGNIRNNRIFSRNEMEEFAHGAGPAGRLDLSLAAGSLGTVVGPLLGAAPCGIAAESALPIASGGRTGLTAMVSGSLFLLSIPLINLFQALPAEAVGAALILAGVFPLMLMFEIDWDNFQQAIPSGLCILLIVATRDFVCGAAIGAASHIVIQTTLGKWRSLHPFTPLTALLLLAAAALPRLPLGDVP